MTPANMDDIASENGMPRTKATIAPVQAPVPGNGTPTKAASAVQRALPETAPALARAFESGLSSSFCTKFDRSARSSGAIGTMLPATHKKKTLGSGMPIIAPTGIAPRSSTTGMAAIVATIHASAKPDARSFAETTSAKWLADAGCGASSASDATAATCATRFALGAAATAGALASRGGARRGASRSALAAEHRTRRRCIVVRACSVSSQ